MKRANPIIIIFILAAAILISFSLPKPKYKGLHILSKLEVPYTFAQWQGKDIQQELDLTDPRYNFISDIFARTYTNKQGATILFLVLDAGNFHNPKVCYGSSGYIIKELNDTDINAASRTFSANTLFTRKGNESTLLLYWLCIDKKITSWTGQKFKELWTSLFGIKKAGLMVRLEIPSREGAYDTFINLRKH
jgi:EpsI family protein